MHPARPCFVKQLGRTMLTTAVARSLTDRNICSNVTQFAQLANCVQTMP